MYSRAVSELENSAFLLRWLVGFLEKVVITETLTFSAGYNLRKEKPVLPYESLPLLVGKASPGTCGIA